MPANKKRNNIFYYFILSVLLVVLIYYSSKIDGLKKNIGNTKDTAAGQQVTSPTFKEIKKQSDTSNWKTYTNKVIGYTIKYPSDWSVSEESFDPGGAMATENSELIDIFPNNIMKDFLMKITIEAFPNLFVTKDDKGLTPTWEKYRKDFQSWSLEDKKFEEVAINGTNFSLTSGTSTEAGIPEDYVSRSYVTQINNGKGAMAVIIRDRSVPRSEIFDQILETLKFGN